jgi:hypothetical protein
MFLVERRADEYVHRDFNKIQGCYCDQGFEGFDCSLRSCPTGDDPHTHFQLYEQQAVQCSTDSGGYFQLTFRQETTDPISHRATEKEVEGDVSVIVLIIGSHGFAPAGQSSSREAVDNWNREGHFHAQSKCSHDGEGSRFEQFSNRDLRQEIRACLCRFSSARAWQFRQRNLGSI